ncbi:MAG: SpoIIE family protein phosphatase [Longicatena sp.]
MEAIIIVIFLLVLLIALLSFLEKKKIFGNITTIKKQIVIGILFALLSIFASRIESDLVDVPALCAGLLFGPVAGLVAGAISAIQISIVSLGADLFTLQIASAASVLAAGIFAGIFRKFLLEDGHPPLIYGVLSVLITKLLFLFALLFANFSDLVFVFSEASDGAITTLLVNSLGVIIGILTARIFHYQEYKKSCQLKTISKSFQFGLLICIIVAFISTFYFTAATQTQIAESQTKDLIEQNLEDAQEYSNTTGQTIDELLDYLPTWRVGQDGGIIALDKEGKVVNDKKMIIKSDKKDILKNIGEMFSADINGESSYCVVSENQGYYFMGHVSVNETLYLNMVSLYSTAFVESLIFVMLFIAAIVLCKKIIVKNINNINNDLQSITNGNLEVRVNVRSYREFDVLSNYINTTVTALKEHMNLIKEKIEKELLFAQEIQHAAIPSIFPPYPNRNDLEIYGSMFTAKEVGGDFYDFYFVGENKLAFVIADVSGKGIPAAMYMMVAKTIIKSYAESGKSVNEILDWANEKLCQQNDVGMFVTAWMGIVDLQTGVVTYANAGHNPPLLCRKGERFAYLRERPNLVLAAMEDVTYKKHELILEKGDILFLYTDGVTEAINQKEELYNEARLYEILNEHKDSSLKEICEKVKSDVDYFIGDEPQFDDITMLAFEYKGVGKSMVELLVNATIDNITKVTEFVDKELERYDCPMKAQLQIDIAIDELFGNIAQYAYNPEVGPATVRVEVINDPLSVIITFVDNGIPYDPLTSMEPNIHLSAEERDLGGLGIYIVKKSMDNISYEYKNGQNILKIKKNL